MNRGNLFNKVMIDDYMSKIRIEIEKEVESLPIDRLNADLGELCQYFVEKHAINVPVLSEHVSADPPPDNPHARAVNLKCYIPFEGEGKLFQVYGRTSPIIFTPCRVEGNNLTVELEVRFEFEEDFNRHKEEFVKQVNSGLKSLKESVDAWSKHIPEWAQQKITQRRAAISQQNKFMQKLASVVPLRKRNDGTEKVVLPPKRIRACKKSCVS
jgi:hypothetical protein